MFSRQLESDLSMDVNFALGGSGPGNANFDQAAQINGVPCDDHQNNTFSKINMSGPNYINPASQLLMSNVPYQQQQQHLVLGQNFGIDPVNLQYRQHMNSMQRSISPGTMSSYGSVSSLSPYMQSSQLLHGRPYHSSNSSSPTPFAEIDFDDGYAMTNDSGVVNDTSPGDENVSAAPYNQLIFECLMSAPDHQMRLKEIYKWFLTNTDKTLLTGWKNSIRHNLSMNDAFKKGSRSDPANSPKTTWSLTDEAINEGCQPTTRYRKNTDRQSRKRTLGSPAPNRQMSGARGGNAARRSQRLRQKDSLFEGHQRGSSTPPACPQPRSWCRSVTPGCRSVSRPRAGTAAITPSLSGTRPCGRSRATPDLHLNQPYGNTAGPRPVPYYARSTTTTPIQRHSLLPANSSAPASYQSQHMQHQLLQQQARHVYQARQMQLYRNQLMSRQQEFGHALQHPSQLEEQQTLGDVSLCSTQPAQNLYNGLPSQAWNHYPNHQFKQQQSSMTFTVPQNPTGQVPSSLAFDDPDFYNTFLDPQLASMPASDYTNLTGDSPSGPATPVFGAVVEKPNEGGSAQIGKLMWDSDGLVSRFAMDPVE